jgi:hypothetical protein
LQSAPEMIRVWLFLVLPALVLHFNWRLAMELFFLDGDAPEGFIPKWWVRPLGLLFAAWIYAVLFWLPVWAVGEAVYRYLGRAGDQFWCLVLAGLVLTLVPRLYWAWGYRAAVRDARNAQAMNRSWPECS